MPESPLEFLIFPHDFGSFCFHVPPPPPDPIPGESPSGVRVPRGRAGMSCRQERAGGRGLE